MSPNGNAPDGAFFFQFPYLLGVFYAADSISRREVEGEQPLGEVAEQDDDPDVDPAGGEIGPSRGFSLAGGRRWARPRRPFFFSATLIPPCLGWLSR